MRIKRAKSGDFTLSEVITLFLIFSPCQALLVNRTIDSQFGDTVTGFVPSYYPPRHAWDDQTCNDCAVQPDPAQTFDGTWMAATYLPQLDNINFTLEFTGIAIWVFFILSNANGLGADITTNTRCNFTLDGALVGNFSHRPDLSRTDLIYNATVFSTTGLNNTPHQLLISVNDYPNRTFVNFDWAMIDVDPSGVSSSVVTPVATSSPDPAPPQKRSPSFLIVVGSVSGALGGGIVGAVITWLLMRRSRREFMGNMDPIYTFRHRKPIADGSDFHQSFTSKEISQLSGDGDPLPGIGGGGGILTTREEAIGYDIPTTQREVDNLTINQSYVDVGYD